MVLKNAERRVNAAICLLEHTAKSGVSNADKSTYYRSAILLLCSVIEGMVYEVVKARTPGPKHAIQTYPVYLERGKVPASILGTTNPVYIAEKETRDLGIDDDGATFGKLNLFLKNRGLITNTQFNHLNWARLERNKIHISAMRVADIGYTMRKINRLGRIIAFMPSLLP